MCRARNGATVREATLAVEAKAATLSLPPPLICSSGPTVKLSSPLSAKWELLDRLEVFGRFGGGPADSSSISSGLSGS